MITPFPGMDPYLERPSYWRMIHLQLIAELARKLNPILRPRYWVATEQYTYTLTLLGPDDMVGMPDVMVVDRGSGIQHQLSATADVMPVVAELPMPEQIVDRYLEIREVDSGEVITAIELLSPTNKQSKDGRRQYEKKRLKLLGSLTHLVEIDLLRGGQPMTMSLSTAKNTDYRILVSRAQQRPLGDVYGFSVRERIPRVPIPLRPGEMEPIIDLNSILHELYDVLNFDLVIDYTKNPVPALSDDDAAWADALLRESELRGGP